ncbi:MAG: class I SAM-dependent methyltransferase, partial [Xanthomonadales bacterium]|nr:class I SAM-dependent methyltransferase [Xanthomonadales bacterium]
MQYKNQEKLLDILESSLHTDPVRPVLDLACGTGRSGLKLAERNIPVVFADRSSAALAEVELYLSKGKLPGSVWRV